MSLIPEPPPPSLLRSVPCSADPVLRLFRAVFLFSAGKKHRDQGGLMMIWGEEKKRSFYSGSVLSLCIFCISDLVFPFPGGKTDVPQGKICSRKELRTDPGKHLFHLPPVFLKLSLILPLFPGFVEILFLQKGKSGPELPEQKIRKLSKRTSRICRSGKGDRLRIYGFRKASPADFQRTAIYQTCIRSPQNTTPTALSTFCSPELVSIPIYPYASRNLTTGEKTFLFLLLFLLSSPKAFFSGWRCYSAKKELYYPLCNIRSG